jgi:hypothetical protein
LPPSANESVNERTAAKLNEYFQQSANTLETNLRRSAEWWLVNPRALATVRLWLSCSEGYTRHFIKMKSVRNITEAEIDLIIRVARGEAPATPGSADQKGKSIISPRLSG